MSISRFPRFARPLLTVMLGLSSAAAAQASPCGAEPTFVEAFIAGQSRGGTLAVILPDGVWVDPQILRVSEANYAGTPVTCALGTFVPLNSQLDVQFDASELTLTVRPQLALLPGNILDLDVPAEAHPPDQTLPLFSVGVNGSVARTQPEQSAVTYVAGVQAGVRVGALTGTAQLTATGQLGAPQPPRVNLLAQTTYDFSERLSGAAVVVASRSDGVTTLSSTQITGVQLTAGDQRAYRLTEVTFDLPLDAEVTLSVDGQAVPTLRAAAGTLRLRNIPLGSPQGVIEARITDSSGMRVETRSYAARDLTVSARAFTVQARAGLKGADRAASLSGAYGITDRWSVTGQGTLTGRDWTAQLGVRYVESTVNAGLSVSGSGGATQALTVAGDVAVQRGAWQYGLNAQVNPLDLADSRVGGRVGWSGVNRSVTADVQARPGRQAYSGNLALTARVNDQVTVAARGQLTQDAGQRSWLAGVTLTYVPRRDVTVTATGAGSSAAPPATLWTADSTVNWQITPEQTVSAAAQFSTLPQRAARLGYAFTGPVTLIASAATDGTWSAAGQAGVAWIGGRAHLTPDDPGPGVLVQVGLPGVPLLVNGARVVSDARGEALILLSPGTRTVSVTPDFDTLPVTVSVREERRDVTLTGQGAAVVDWIGNFEAFVWVRVLGADGAPLPYASVDVQGARRADDEGWVLVPAFGAPLRAPVTLDGAAAPACQVTLTPGVESVRCAP